MEPAISEEKNPHGKLAKDDHLQRTGKGLHSAGGDCPPKSATISSFNETQQSKKDQRQPRDGLNDGGVDLVFQQASADGERGRSHPGADWRGGPPKEKVRANACQPEMARVRQRRCIPTREQQKEEVVRRIVNARLRF